MTVPYFGLQFPQIVDDALPPVLSDFSVFSWTDVSEDANPSIFPLNTPVAINTGDAATLAALGTGPLYKAVLRINAQLADYQRSARGVIVRVATGQDDAHTMANVLGDSAQRTGVYALLKAPSLCKVTPRLNGAAFTWLVRFGVVDPVITAAGVGYTNPIATFSPTGATATVTKGNAGVRATGTATLSSGGVGAIAVTNPGSLYPSAPAVTMAGGGGTGATAHSIVLNGVVTGIVVDAAGTGYTSAPTVSLAAPPGGQITAINLTSPGNYAPGITPTVTISDSGGGTGTGATVAISLEELANPVCQALASINSLLLAHSYVGGPGGTMQDALAWRQTLNSQRLIPEDAWEIIPTLDGLSTEYIDGAATSIGLQIRVDFEHEGFPFWSIANRPIQGILGVKRIDDFSLFDGATDAQELLTAGIGVTVAGDATDGALDDSGYLKIVLNNASSNTLFNLYNKTRGRDFTTLALAKSIRHRLGTENVTVAGVQAVENDMLALMVLLASKKVILGYRIGFKAKDNTVEGIRAGKFTLYDDTEEAAPIIQITVNRGLDSDAVVNELAQLTSGISEVAA